MFTQKLYTIAEDFELELIQEEKGYQIQMNRMKD